MGKYLSISSYIMKPFLICTYMTLQLLHSEFPYTVYKENFTFVFISAATWAGSRAGSPVSECVSLALYWALSLDIIQKCNN